MRAPFERSRVRMVAVAAILAGIVFGPAQSYAGDWRVAPIRVELGERAKTAAVTIINNSPEKTLLQMNLSEWTQDAEGRDRYVASRDLVFFPKIMSFETSGEKLIRIGLKMPAGAVEKTYRLYIEEIPGPRKKSKGANVLIAIRFGLPVFVRPRNAKPEVMIKDFFASNGSVGVRLKNAGNVHAVIHSVVLKGKNRFGTELFTKKLNGWYLLAGASRVYSAPVPRKLCAKVSSVAVRVESNEGSLEGKLDDTKAICSP